MKQKIISLIETAVQKVGISDPVVKLDYPEVPEHGDFSTNVALAYAKQLGLAPKVLAEKIVKELKDLTIEPAGGEPLNDSESKQLNSVDFIKKISVAGPGFINFKLKDEVFAKEVLGVAGKLENDLYQKSLKGTSLNQSSHQLFGEKSTRQSSSKGESEQVLIEYTDPNTFKAFHIGHIMSNTIGESISRLIENTGTKVVRICYPSDIGLHIAKSIWAMEQHLDEIPSEAAPIEERTAFLGKMYVEGTNAYDADPLVKNEIDELNQAIYDRSDDAVNDLYDKGREWSLEHFDLLYELLGTKFDMTIFESEMAPVGLKIVKENIRGKEKVESTIDSELNNSTKELLNDGTSDISGVFEESDGAIVFKGEEYGLHTRVFINSRGLPTYETKDVGLNVTKFEKFPDTVQSIIITANEQNDYFKVLTKVFSLIDAKNGGKTMHIGHGMLRFAEGKMSSRTGNVVTADALIGDIKKMVMEKIAGRDFSADDVGEIADMIAVGAVKYTILRQAIGGNVVFDSAASISFEGDSGPYLQYSAVRAASVLEKVGGGTFSGTSKTSKFSATSATSATSAKSDMKLPETVGLLEKLIVRFPDIAERARAEYAPQHVAGYLVQLAGAFNAFYANQTIIDEKDPLMAYRVELVRAFLKTMTRGLWLLGIEVPKKM